MSLLILEDNPQRGGAYEERLEHRDPVYIPVQPCALVEAIVCFRANKLRYSWRKDMEDEVVAQEAEQDLVDMVRERRQAQLISKRIAGLHE